MSPKLTHTDKTRIRQYIEPHTDEQAAKKFSVPIAAVRAIINKGVVKKYTGKIFKQ